jgi:DmsE family decaheme c-type cytochrome
VTGGRRIVTRLKRLLLLLLLSSVFPLASSAAEVCETCHRSQTDGFAHRSNDVGCTACHGTSEAHLSNPVVSSPDTTFSLAEDDAGERCVSCHEGSRMMYWQGSGHELAGTTCNLCHRSHGEGLSEPELCLSCHGDLRSSQHLPSRHPIAEGKVNCTDCHSPHGSANENLLHGDMATDVCTRCHSDYRGPFLFEHDPVTEDCTICHKPHGSVQPAMLDSRPPFLCQQCHMGVNHVGELNDGGGIAARSPNLIGKSCLNCHSRVHGSNHPSGARLTR